MFADGVVFVGENPKEVNKVLEKWRSAFEGKRISGNKTMKIVYDSGGNY